MWLITLSTQQYIIHWKPLMTYDSVLDESPETLVTYHVNPLTSTSHYLKLPMKLDKSVRRQVGKDVSDYIGISR